jgi:hypothetical protein
MKHATGQQSKQKTWHYGYGDAIVDEVTDLNTRLELWKAKWKDATVMSENERDFWCERAWRARDSVDVFQRAAISSYIRRPVEVVRVLEF